MNKQLRAVAVAVLTVVGIVALFYAVAGIVSLLDEPDDVGRIVTAIIVSNIVAVLSIAGAITLYRLDKGGSK